jgi:molecular chaperone DnaJ
MAATRDYYEVLRVERTASQEDIKRAFRRLAREYHPDVKQDDPHASERFKEINEAYQVLSDPSRRAQYDRFGTVVPFTTDDVRGSGFGPFDDIFDMFFGRRGGAAERDEPQRGADLRYDLEISLEEAAAGLEKTVELVRLETCPACFGTGAERGSAPETCPTCRGAGEVRYAQRTIFGSFTQIGTCQTCRGTGRVQRHPCKQCEGSGRAETKRSLTAKIPPGVDTGNRLRLAGEGEAGALGGPRGDLYVFLTVRQHAVFERDGQDLFCRVPISIVQAALGDEIEIPTLDGPVKNPIAAGSQPGSQVTVRGKGMPDPRGGGRGDLHVRLDVRVPTSLTAEERRLLLELAKAQGHEVKPQKKKLTDKVKDLLQ